MIDRSDTTGESGRLPFPPVMLAVAGASGSGKTTLAAELARTLGGLHFPLDTYYRDLAHLPVEERALQNFDDPAMIDVPLLASNLQALSQGHSIERPLYSFAEFTRIPGKTETIRRGSLVVVEGLFALYFPELRPLYQLSVFVDTPDDICFARRLKRDIEERGRDPESVRRQYAATVRPCSLAFVRPLIDFADLVVDGADSLDFKIELVVNTLRKRGLLGRLEPGFGSRIG
ncbi:uridine kinase [Acidicapsa acidisoli]|uniref:uridine kinase n=1 Tax=Acidicapsa acidisoli TaxID=1615681 RepID=UPI0021E0F008|nr:uridine kinase [Acidicapsa acidisoli]